jgi:hypothetical protein
MHAQCMKAARMSRNFLSPESHEVGFLAFLGENALGGAGLINTHHGRTSSAPLHCMTCKKAGYHCSEASRFLRTLVGGFRLFNVIGVFKVIHITLLALSPQHFLFCLLLAVDFLPELDETVFAAFCQNSPLSSIFVEWWLYLPSR